VPFGVVDAFLPVLADRLQQPVAGLEAVILGDDQRPGHQPLRQLEDGRRIDAAAGTDGLGGFECPATAEHGHPIEQPLFGLAQQVVGPVDHRP
jgi:hypothetical protein